MAAIGLLAVPVACGGDDNDASDVADEITTAASSQPTATVDSAALVGTWTSANEPLVVRFTPDGKFAMDGDGSLENGQFVKGTYTIEGSRVRFADAVGPRGCGGQEWEWQIALSESGMLEAENLQEVCQTPAGTRWSLEKRPDS